MGDGSSGSNPLSAFSSQAGNALSGLSSGLSNLFGGADATAAITGDTSGMSGFNVADLFSNVGSDAFNQDTASIQATQAITPPAQAQEAAATGQDPSAGIGGTQSSGGTQTASTGPSGQNQNQPTQDQQERNNAIDELRRLLKQRQKQQQQPPQWNPRYASEPQRAAAISPQAAIDAGLSAPNISPDAAVKAGLLDPSLIDPATGQIRRDQPPPAEDPLGSSVTESSGQADPSVEPPPTGPRVASEGRVPWLEDTPPPGRALVPYTGGQGAAPAGVPGLPGLGLPGLGWLPWILRGALGGVASVPFTATPAETGELPSKYWPKPEDASPEDAGPEDPEIRARQQEGMSPGQRPDSPAPPSPAATAPRKEQPKPKPKAAPPPRRVWVPPTPGHYVPTPGIGRGSPTWVPGTPGHWQEAHAPGQGRPPAAVAPAAGIHAQNAPEAVRRLSEARAEAPAASPEVMAYNQDARISPMLRDILGIAMPQTMAALARFSGQGRPNAPSNLYGRGGTRPYNENWGGRAYVRKGDEVQRGRQYMGYLTGKGLTPQGAAALLGNAHQESNLSATLAPGGDDGTAAGMFQWRGSRQAAFRRWLAANGRSESDPNAHLDFALLEMQSDPRFRQSWAALHNPNLSVAQIADILANNFEVSKRGPSQGMNNRIGFANDMLQGGGQPTTTAAAPSGGGFRITDPNQNPLTSHTYPAPGETSAPQAMGGDAQG